MKKIFIKLLIIIFCFFIFCSIYDYSKNKKVYIIGSLIGFDVELNIFQETNFSKTSSKSVGTLTFIDDKNNFVALGHSISDSTNITANCYGIDINNIEKSMSHSLGKINATLNKNNFIATAYSNSDYGILGTSFLDTSSFPKIQTASRFSVRNGSAKILINLDNTEIKEYNINIDYIDYFDKNKNIKITITDNNLINLTGGIIQGMSGAPIVQNSKLIGAINFANSKNPLEGYGIFIDKLLK